MAIEYADFEQVDVRVGKILMAEAFPEAKKPAYKLTIDFGPHVGTKRSSAQITENYTVDDLLGRLVLGVVNLPVKQIGPFASECLTLGFPDSKGFVVLAAADKDVPLGSKLF